MATDANHTPWKPVDGDGLGARLMNWAANWVADLGENVEKAILALGDIANFSFSTIWWLFTRRPYKGTLLTNFYQIGVLSLPVVALTGVFIGMVLAVQSYAQFRMLGMETRMGAVINMSLVRELGPVLAATMLAGRVGSAMAAELGTMRVTEQIDALSAMGANPIHLSRGATLPRLPHPDTGTHDNRRFHGRRGRCLLQHWSARYRLTPLLGEFSRVRGSLRSV
jgi:hypothetical protein